MVGQCNIDTNPTLLRQKSVGETVVVSEMAPDDKAELLQRSKSSYNSDGHSNSDKKTDTHSKLNDHRNMVASAEYIHSPSDSDSGIDDARGADSDNIVQFIEPQYQQQYTSPKSENAENFDINNFSSMTCEQHAGITAIINDAELAASIKDIDKKDFCDNTATVFHGEFARLILARTLKYGVEYGDYRLMLYDQGLNVIYDCKKVDNAKAQFKCTKCSYAWTSMRARCLFYITQPQVGIIALQLCNQICSKCQQTVQPLWYIDEVCRVMKNLAATVFKIYFQNEYADFMATNSSNDSTRQRKGAMKTTHRTLLCDACRLGVCFPQNTKNLYHY
ncbi:unnamed protein product [Didymodactylos carnosus]|uniref:3CxxC-type domain-containing protein n=1 Tax=Didymodactylos carnosus TaxID=1234261 RepID=A0A813UAG7_9BILA|nr:unnamed protein product [Didymodactylos carnosus]CAF0823546.1 unnamed protein product [Didymodactylos carnosus]CAF3508791.1 unnamed protein product [Didymodactylos carnosus]CAF3610172.1 unnamed protein product [Didymodactylos carnosus]